MDTQIRMKVGLMQSGGQTTRRLISFRSHFILGVLVRRAI